MSIHRSTNRPGLLTAQEAAQILAIKPQTLYTYASRGWVRTVRPGGRRRLYVEADVLALRRRAEAHRGTRPAAEGALHWGAPVLGSAITEIDPDGPTYRGVPALTFVETGASFEAVCAHLWQFDPPWPAARPARTRSVAAHPIRAMQRALLDLAITPDSAEPDVPRAYASLMAAAAPQPGVSVAARIAATTGVVEVGAVEAALILCADHELNPSTFAVRIAASTGASLADCLLAGLATLSGPRHGGLSDAVESWLAGGAYPDQAGAHPLYAAGDPRGEWLVERAFQRASPDAAAQLRTRLAHLGHSPQPTLDTGLGMLAYALGAKPHAAITWFALGRAAGWIAHALEQRESGEMLRPRARYTGP